VTEIRKSRAKEREEEKEKAKATNIREIQKG
jgi:hypothetical protein